MGQVNSLMQSENQGNRHHIRSSTLLTQKASLPLKTIRLKHRHEEKLLPINDNFLTCGWLLSEAIRVFPYVCPIVGVRCAERADVIDAWLQDFERSVNIIKDNTLLVPVVGQTIQDLISLAWFEPVSVIGKGGFSNVFLVRKKDNGYLYALKVMQKSYILKENKAKHVLSECRILQRIKHPFIIQMRYSFQTPSELLIVSDFCPGGELFFHLHNIGRFTEEQARFYFAEVLLAVEYLHKEKIIFRDLKPENTLIDLDGHIRLIDFGLAREDKGERLHSFCGSHEYLSPEMIKRSGYNKSVDFYGLGSFLYEMLTGLPPFYDTDREKLYNRILHEELKVPKYLSIEVKSLLRGLLRKEPTLRLGSILGIREIKEHPWLVEVDWSRVLQKKVNPPFRPNSTKSNFDTEHLSGSLNDQVFQYQEFYDPKNDPVFEDFFYVNGEKTRNYELFTAFEAEETWDRNSSFAETRVLPKNALIQVIAINKPYHLVSTSQSPAKKRNGKTGPELLSIKVPPKVVKKASEPESRKPIKKSSTNVCNKSYINSRKSLIRSKLELD